MGNTLFKPGASAGLSNPMTTGGDIIYGDNVGNPVRLANGTTGQFLQSSGTTLAPSWANLPGVYNWHGYFPASTTNYWSVTTAAGYTHVPPSGTIPSPTELNNSNFGTVAKGISNYPGIIFSAPRTGTLKINVIADVLGSNATAASAWAIKMRETISAADIGFIAGKSWGAGNTIISFPVPMHALLNTTAGATYNIELLAVTGAGTFFFGAVSDAGSELDFLLEYIS